MDDQRANRTSDASVIIFWTLIVVSGLPLIAYPFVLFANLMSLIAERPKEPLPLGYALIFYGFLLATTAYPAVWIVCGAIGWNRAHWGSAKSTVFWSLAPLLYLLLIVAFCVAMNAMWPQEEFRFPTH
jgi:hypothetical protein